jgi:hypothetical protein
MPAQLPISADDRLPVAAVCLSLIVIWVAALVAKPLGNADATGAAVVGGGCVDLLPPGELSAGRRACARPGVWSARTRGLAARMTPHSVTGAAYHRDDKSIVFEELVMRGSVEAARERLHERGVAYVMSCADFPAYPNFDSERVPLPDDNVLRMWRVRG